MYEDLTDVIVIAMLLILVVDGREVYIATTLERERRHGGPMKGAQAG